MKDTSNYIGISGYMVRHYGYKVHIAIDNGQCYKKPGVFTEILNKDLGSAKSLCGMIDIPVYDKKSLVPLDKFDMSKITCLKCLSIHKEKMAKMKTTDFSKIHCWECGRKVRYYFTTFFIDKNGLKRYGSVCKKCYEKVRDR